MRGVRCLAPNCGNHDVSIVLYLFVDLPLEYTVYKVIEVNYIIAMLLDTFYV